MIWWRKRDPLGLIIEPDRFGIVAWPTHKPVCLWHAYTAQEIIELTLFNPTVIARAMQKIIYNYSLRSPYVILAFDGPELYETLIPLDRDKISEPKNSKPGWAYSSCLISEKWRYSAQIPYYIRAQYYLLAAHVPFELACITTITAAYYQTLSSKSSCFESIITGDYTSIHELKRALREACLRSCNREYDDNNSDLIYAPGLYDLAQRSI
jgi:hypothetical protein